MLLWWPSVLLVLGFIGVQPISAGLTLDDFFPFGPGNGDNQLRDGDDEVVSVDFLSDFFFFGQAYTFFGVCVLIKSS